MVVMVVVNLLLDRTLLDVIGELCRGHSVNKRRGTSDTKNLLLKAVLFLQPGTDSEGSAKYK
jgi:hypothetical protein